MAKRQPGLKSSRSSPAGAAEAVGLPDSVKSFAANFNNLGLKRLICTSNDDSPLTGQMTLFDENNAGNGQRKKPKAIAVIVDHVKDENNDGGTARDGLPEGIEHPSSGRLRCL